MLATGKPFDGFRNKIINGNFDIWQRGTSQTSGLIASADRWSFENWGSTKTNSRQAFPIGETAVPGNPAFFCRTVCVTGGASSNYNGMRQKIESVRTFAGKKATITFYAKADAPKNIAFYLSQYFGGTGSPSPSVPFGGQQVALSTSWQRFSLLVDVPSIAGKTLGNDGSDHLQLIFFFEAGSAYNSFIGALGSQSGTFDVARVSMVEGDARNEDDPFTQRHIEQEMALCQRYFEMSYGAGQVIGQNTGMTGGVEDFAGLIGRVRFQRPKRANPTIKVYDAVGNAGRISIDGATNNVAPTTVDNLSSNGFKVFHTGATRVMFHWTADAEL